jgi:hypothetical protein
MRSSAQHAEAIRGILARPAGGVVEIVNDLLRVCQEQGIQIDWRDNRCRVRTVAGGPEEVIDQPLRKAALRAILARVAALCKEQRPDSVTPYGGEGELSVGAGPTSALRVSFANTPEEQWLRLALSPPSSPPSSSSAPPRTP